MKEHNSYLSKFAISQPSQDLPQNSQLNDSAISSFLQRKSRSRSPSPFRAENLQALSPKKIEIDQISKLLDPRGLILHPCWQDKIQNTEDLQQHIEDLDNYIKEHINYYSSNYGGYTSRQIFTNIQGQLLAFEHNFEENPKSDQFSAEREKSVMSRLKAVEMKEKQLLQRERQIIQSKAATKQRKETALKLKLHKVTEIEAQLKMLENHLDQNFSRLNSDIEKLQKTTNALQAKSKSQSTLQMASQVTLEIDSAFVRTIVEDIILQASEIILRNDAKILKQLKERNSENQKIIDNRQEYLHRYQKDLKLTAQDLSIKKVDLRQKYTTKCKKYNARQISIEVREFELASELQNTGEVDRADLDVIDTNLKLREKNLEDQEQELIEHQFEIDAAYEMMLGEVDKVKELEAQLIRDKKEFEEFCEQKRIVQAQHRQEEIYQENWVDSQADLWADSHNATENQKSSTGRNYQQKAIEHLQRIEEIDKSPIQSNIQLYEIIEDLKFQYKYGMEQSLACCRFLREPPIKSLFPPVL